MRILLNIKKRVYYLEYLLQSKISFLSYYCITYERNKTNNVEWINLFIGVRSFIGYNKKIYDNLEYILKREFCYYTDVYYLNNKYDIFQRLKYCFDHLKVVDEKSYDLILFCSHHQFYCWNKLNKLLWYEIFLNDDEFI